MIENGVKNSLLEQLGFFSKKLLAAAKATSQKDIEVAISKIPVEVTRVNWDTHPTFSKIFKDNSEGLLKDIPMGHYYGRVTPFIAEGLPESVSKIAYLKLVIIDIDAVRQFVDNTVIGYFAYQIDGQTYFRAVESHDEVGNVIVDYPAFFRELDNRDGDRLEYLAETNPLESNLSLLAAVDNIGLEEGRLSTYLDGAKSKRELQFVSDGTIVLNRQLGGHKGELKARLLPIWADTNDYQIKVGTHAQIQVVPLTATQGFVSLQNITAKLLSDKGVFKAVPLTIEVKHVETDTITSFDMILTE